MQLRWGCTPASSSNSLLDLKLQQGAGRVSLEKTEHCSAEADPHTRSVGLLLLQDCCCPRAFLEQATPSALGSSLGLP